MKELKKELDELLNKIDCLKEDYCFYCSKDFNSNLKSYKNIEINYINSMPSKTIYYFKKGFYNKM